MRLFSFAAAALIVFGGGYAGAQLSARPLVIERPDQDIRSQARQMSYEPLARQPEKFAGALVMLRGKVVDIVDDGNDLVLRVNITQDAFSWKDTVAVRYPGKSGTGARIMPHDTVRLWGTFVGVESDPAASGVPMQIPHVIARIVETMRKT